MHKFRFLTLETSSLYLEAMRGAPSAVSLTVGGCIQAGTGTEKLSVSVGGCIQASTGAEKLSEIRSASPASTDCSDRQILRYYTSYNISDGCHSDHWCIT